MADLEVARKEITDLVILEIAGHRAGTVKTFTPYAALMEEYDVSRRKIKEWVAADLSAGDIKYRADHLGSTHLRRQGRTLNPGDVQEHVSAVEEFLGTPDCGEDEDLSALLNAYDL